MKTRNTHADVKTRRNNDKVFKKAPALLSILMKVEGYSLADIFNFRNGFLSEAEQNSIYSTFRRL